jgi:hypothetical protein
LTGSVADRCKIHAASMLYHIQNGSVPKLAGNIELTFYDLLDQLHTGHYAPGVEEALESWHREWCALPKALALKAFGGRCFVC